MKIGIILTVRCDKANLYFNLPVRRFQYALKHCLGHNEDDTNSAEDDRLTCRLRQDFKAQLRGIIDRFREFVK